MNCYTFYRQSAFGRRAFLYDAARTYVTVCQAFFSDKDEDYLREQIYVLLHYIIVGLICLVVGFWLGGLHGRKVKRDAMRELNTNSLDMLETKSRVTGIEAQYADYQEKEKLLQVTLQQLKGSNEHAKRSSAQAVDFSTRALQSEAQVKKLQLDLVSFNKKQKLNQTFLKLKAQKTRKLAIQSHVRAVKAAAIARKATAHLKQLENAVAAGQNLAASESRPQGGSDRVKLSVVDQPRLGAGEKMLKQVSNNDTARLAKLSSSKKVTSPQI